MTVNKVILLACGSFNPPTNMHLRMFEIARDHLHRLGNSIVIGGIVSPVHDAYGKNGLEASTHRIKMLELALQTSDWIKLSKWEINQETWTRTKQTLQYHQNQINAFLKSSTNEEEISWIPENLKNGLIGNVQIKLLCGADLLESFATPGLWAEEDIETILGQHGLVVITRVNSNPLEFIYNSDLLTKYYRNIQIVTEWITNEISSTKIRRCIRRSESVKYLIPDDVIDYIYQYGLYGSSNNKYTSLSVSNSNSSYLIPSPSDVIMDSPSPVNSRCLVICDNTFSKKSNNDTSTLGNVMHTTNNNLNMIKHPGQAVKIISDSKGEHKIIREPPESNKKVCKSEESQTAQMKTSRSCTNFMESKMPTKISKSNMDLKDCKNCDENLVKFIFTKHGIQVISDIETIV